MIVKFFAVIIITPIFFLPGVLVAVLGAVCGQIYIKAQLSVKREMSNAKSPVLGQYVFVSLLFRNSLSQMSASELLLLGLVSLRSNSYQFLPS